MDAEEARIYVAIIITVFLLAVIIFYFALTVVRQQRRNLELQKANAFAEITAMEKERARIATDLHDDFGPVLSVIKFRVDNAKPSNPEEQAELATASQQLDGMVRRIREVANNLMPSALIRKGLTGAVKEFTDNVTSGTPLQITFQSDPSLIVDEDKSINVYRIIQELVHNTLKHASATRQEIIFERYKEGLRIICRDNGKGFEFKPQQSSGIGLRSIQNRTEIMGGTLTVDSKVDKGSAFLFEIPLP